MPKTLRFLAVLLLAMSLPVQGMASIAAGLCMTLGHHQEDGKSHDHEASQLDGADGHEHAAHADHGSVTGQQSQDDKSAHCGPCTACCATASIAGFVGTAIPSSPSNTEHVFSQPPPSGFQPDGVDRPPLAL